MSRRRKKRSRGKFQERVHNGSASVSTPTAGSLAGPASQPAVALGATERDSQEVRNLPAAVPVFSADAPHHQVLDEDGHPVFVSESDARALMLKGRATFIRISKHLRGIRVLPEILRESQRGGSIREGSVTDPTDSDSENNARGVWSWNAAIYRKINGNMIRVPATSRTFRALPRSVEQVLLEERRRFFERLAA